MIISELSLSFFLSLLDNCGMAASLASSFAIFSKISSRSCSAFSHFSSNSLISGVHLLSLSSRSFSLLLISFLYFLIFFSLLFSNLLKASCLFFLFLASFSLSFFSRSSSSSFPLEFVPHAQPFLLPNGLLRLSLP